MHTCRSAAGAAMLGNFIYVIGTYNTYVCMITTTMHSALGIVSECVHGLLHGYHQPNYVSE